MAGEGQIKGKDIINDDVFARLKELDSSLAGIIARMNEIQSTGVRANSNSSLAGVSKRSIDLNKEANIILQEQKKLTDSLVASEKKAQQQRIADLRLQKQREQAFDKYERQLKQQEALAKRTAKSEKEAQRAFVKLNNERERAKKILQDLIASGSANNDVLRRAQNEFNKLDARVRQANQAVKDGRMDVGRYQLATKGLIGTLRNLVGAFGITSGILIFAQGLRDAFARIRDFDKSIANLSGILGKTVPELKGLRQEIIDVAGASIRTSNQVADLATALVTLGKTESEVKKLLKPTNDLSIALQASSEDAGQLLVGILNAFGEGAEEADKFANIIAKLRLGSALDFEQIKDAFGFIAPTAKAANISIEKTAALLGILADNNIRGERAGRLLSSALLRLSEDGKTLDDALSILNKSAKEGATELEQLALANNLFSSQAAPLGLILANNTDRIKEFTSELENSSGSLDQLTNAQLQSLDAKLKILDSTWEKFLLTAQDTDNFLGKFFVFTVERLTQSIESLSINLDFLSGKLSKEVASAKFIKTLEGIMVNFFGFKDAVQGAADAILELDEKQRKNVETINEQTEAFVKQYGSLAPLQQGYRDLAAAQNFYSDRTEKEARILSDISDEISKLNDEIESSFTTDIKGIRLKQEKIKALEAERDAILGNSNTKKAEIKIIKDSIAFYQELINTQKELQSKTALNSTEFNIFKRAIEEAEGSILNLQGAFDNFEVVITPSKLDLSKILEITDFDASNIELELFNDVDRFLNTEGVRQGMEVLAANLRTPIEELYRDFESLYEKDFKSFLEFTKAKTEAEIEANERRLDVQTEVVNIVGDLSNSLFQIQEQRVQKEIDKQNEAYDAIINGKDATEEQIRIAEIKKAENEKKLDKEREKRQKRAFLIEQALNVAKIFMADSLARASALASTGLIPFPGNLAALATMNTIISTNTGLALAAVLAQSLPAFFRGKGLEDNYEGLATWGEKRKEVKIGADGRIEISPNKTTPLYVKKDDIILKSVPEFHSQMNNPQSEAFKRVASNLRSDTQYRTEAASTLGIELAIKKGFKGVRNHINIINRIDNRVRKY